MKHQFAHFILICWFATSAKAQILKINDKNAFIQTAKQEIIKNNIFLEFTIKTDTSGDCTIIPFYRLNPMILLSDIQNFDTSKIDFTVKYCEGLVYITHKNNSCNVFKMSYFNQEFYYTNFNTNTNLSDCGGLYCNTNELDNLILNFIRSNPDIHVFQIIGLDKYWCYFNNKIYKLNREGNDFCLMDTQEYWDKYVSKAYITQLLTP
jgi:hypothetical protein